MFLPRRFMLSRFVKSFILCQNFMKQTKVCLRKDLNLSILLISVDEDLNALLTPNIRSVYIVMFFQFPVHSILSFAKQGIIC